MKVTLYPWSVLAACFLGGVATPLVLPFAGQFVDWLFPVVEDWKPSSISRDGDDLLVSGTMVKTRPCHYIPPPRARSTSGQHFPVISTAPTAGLSWLPAETGQRFGSWRVVGGAHSQVTFYVQYKCTNLWDTYTELGTVDGPTLKVVD